VSHVIIGLIKIPSVIVNDNAFLVKKKLKDDDLLFIIAENKTNTVLKRSIRYLKVS
jgi:hypothetical protein